MKWIFYLLTFVIFILLISFVYSFWQKNNPSFNLFTEETLYLPFSDFVIQNKENFSKIVAQNSFSFQVPSELTIQKKEPEPKHYVFYFFYQEPKINEVGFPDRCLIKFWVEKNPLFYQYLYKLLSQSKTIQIDKIKSEIIEVEGVKMLKSLAENEKFGTIVQLQFPYKNLIYNFEAFFPKEDAKCQNDFQFILNSFSFLE